MNLKVHEVLSDLCGASGLRMIRAIVAGERDPEKLLALCDERILSSKRERMRAALQGTWSEPHLFALRQALEGWEFFRKLVEQCDVEIARELRTLAEAVEQNRGTAGPGNSAPPAQQPQPPPKKRGGKNAPANGQAIGGLLERVFGGIDLRQVPGLSHANLTQLLAEIGPDPFGFAQGRL